MCGTCGCSGEEEIQIRKPGEETHHHNNDDKKCSCHKHDEDDHKKAKHEHKHDEAHHHHNDKHDSHSHDKHHSHSHDDDHNHDGDHHHSHEKHSHSHDSNKSGSKEIQLELDILHSNNLVAERNRGYFEAKNIFSLNLVSSPGSGKTSLLERTIKEIGSQIPFYIIEGDQQTMNDADRIQAAGAPVVQINTGSGCHLDATMIHKATKKLEVKDNAVLIIENVGNLVCPAMFDLGEDKRVVVISVTEGEDKPLKYPAMFQSSNLCIINKIDLLPYLDFDIEKCKSYIKQINPNLNFFEVSVKTGEGMEAWYNWLKENTGKSA